MQIRPTLISLALVALVSCAQPPTTGIIDVSISPPGPFNLMVGQKQQLTATVTNTSNKSVSWQSDKPGVASVTPQGLVEGKSAGNAVITATSNADPSKSAQVKVSVSTVPPPPPGSGVISGTVSVGTQASTAAQADAPFVPGELIVKFKPGVSLQSVTRLSVSGVELQQVRPLSLENTYLYRAAMTKADTRAALSVLQSRSDVEYAQPNYILSSFAVPNDPSYTNQKWHYEAINLPAAWDVASTTQVKVAVVDGGIVKAHSDLSANLLSGYDFVSDASTSGDGDGRDGDPEDVAPGTDYHGTHVAGTIGAVTNNNNGVAGVAWALGTNGIARIIPVRALAAGNGTTADVVDALRWAAGFGVSGVLANGNPADIINMSLGGPVACSQTPTIQDAINQVVGAGKMIVVAAGNSNVDASTFSPAGCSGVITVGASNSAGNRASYSNFGPRIDVMAPGGEPGGQEVFSTVGPGSSYGGKAGTSMAAPHVAGVLALLKSKKPSLTPGEALSVLKSTASAIASCGANCGAGLINARAALDKVAPPAPTPSLGLSTSPSAVTAKPGDSVTISVNVFRSNFSGNVVLNISGLPSGVSSNFPQTTAGNATLTLNIGSGTAEGTYSLTISANQEGNASVSASAKVTLTVKKPAPTPPPTASVKDVKIFFDGVTSESPLSIIFDNNPLIITQDATSASYTRSNLSTDILGYRISAWKDLNGNGTQDEGDLFTWYMAGGKIATVKPDATNINLKLEPILSTTYTRDQMMREIRQFGKPSR